MGQAKNRGTPDERKRQAEQRAIDALPDYLTCNECGGKVTDLKPLPTKGMTGVRSACAGTCSNCGNITWGIDSEPGYEEATAEFFSRYYDGKAGFEAIPTSKR